MSGVSLTVRPYDCLCHFPDAAGRRFRFQDAGCCAGAVRAKFHDVIAVLRCADAGRNHHQHVRVDFMQCFHGLRGVGITGCLTGSDQVRPFNEVTVWQTVSSEP